MRRNKFNAIKVKTEYGTFDSKKEYAYFKRLMIQKKAVSLYDRVTDIQTQVRYDIDIAGKRICFYKLDFKVRYADGRVEHVDVKGHKKGSAYNLFRIKKKLVEAIYGIEIIEV
jgi:hypothetical protein